MSIIKYNIVLISTIGSFERKGLLHHVKKTTSFDVILILYTLL